MKQNVLASSERNITFNNYGVFPCFSLISKGYLLITFAFHIPLFDLKIYHNQCFTDFDIKWFAFVFALPSCVSCSTCLSVSVRGQILSQATNACSEDYNHWYIFKKLSYFRGDLMHSFLLHSLTITHSTTIIFWFCDFRAY